MPPLTVRFSINSVCDVVANAFSVSALSAALKADCRVWYPWDVDMRGLITRGGRVVKVAVTVLGAFIVTVHAVPLTLSQPVQPPKPDRLGVAVNITVDPVGKMAG